MFLQALRINPISIKALLGAARISVMNHKAREGQYYFKKAIALEPDSDQAV